MTSGWGWFVVVLVLANVAGAMWLLFAHSHAPAGEAGGETTGHVWDGDLRDANRPLPRWWFWLFVLSTAWGLFYLILYPGLGGFPGVLRWSQEAQHAAEVRDATERQAPRYARFAGMTLVDLSREADAMGEARSLYANNCAGCHGSDARGAVGFPDLTDAEWLYGQEPDTLVATISEGRMGVMPGWEAALGADGVAQLVAFLQSLEGADVDAATATAGRDHYALFCVACHGVDARGNAALGGPDLTNGIWLHGGDAASLRVSIAAGRQNQMPPHGDLLGPDRVRLLAAYVLGLGAGAGDGRAARGN
ncbi:MAG: cytochrome-c oxidase, cbb3-type subunit III [Gammaproteobacteria bacterium]|nr:cytochrome-c oxidase, cbb3-type subunit III [Gammaproteobacteria bacterium]